MMWCNIILVLMGQSASTALTVKLFITLSSSERYECLTMHRMSAESVSSGDTWPLLADGFHCLSVLLHVRWTGSSRVSCQIAAMLQMNTTASLTARTLAGQFRVKTEIQYLLKEHMLNIFLIFFNSKYGAKGPHTAQFISNDSVLLWNQFVKSKLCAT